MMIENELFTGRTDLPVRRYLNLQNRQHVRAFWNVEGEKLKDTAWLGKNDIWDNSISSVLGFGDFRLEHYEQC